MLQPNVLLCHIGRHDAHRVRRYIHDSVASYPGSDAEGLAADRAHVARVNRKPIRLQRISAFLPPASCAVSSGGPL